ncbi:MAG: rhomboid family intramembrane serine protease [bacterium]
MFPLRDTVPSRSVPVVTWTLLVLNAVAWLYEPMVFDRLHGVRTIDPAFMSRYGLVPLKFFWYGEAHPFDWWGRFSPILTSMFLHASWMHFLGNMLFLWIFGDNVEDRLGKPRFVLFYLLCGTVAALIQTYLVPRSGVPMVGASGAIAGVLGSYFLFFPRARVLTVVPIFFFIQVIEIPAFFFLGFWFLMQFLSGAATVGDAGNGGGVAFGAHVGGFLAGLVLGPLLARRTARKATYPTREVFHPW